MSPVQTDKHGRKYVLMNTGPYKDVVVYLKQDGSFPCAGERGDSFTTCSCGYPHKPCNRLSTTKDQS